MKANKKKIGILLYGVTRGQGGIVSQKFKEFVINELKKNFDLTIFLHCFTMNEMAIDPRRKKNNVIKIEDKQDWKLFNPDFAETKDQMDFFQHFDYKNFINLKFDHFADKYYSIRNYINSLHSLQKCFELSKDFKFDCYLCSRLDLLYRDNIKLLTSVNDVINNPNKNILYTPVWNKSTGLNDRISIGNHNVMSAYSNRINQYKNHKTLHPERFLLHLSKSHNFINKTFRMYASRIRVDGSTLNWPS
jgi:hypothetical protein